MLSMLGAFSELVHSYFKVEAATMSNRAVAVLQGNDVNGTVWFTQEKKNGPVQVEGEFTGMSPGLHGFHVHQYGDRTNGCTSAGPHFNPYKKTHGAPEEQTTITDRLGNVKVEQDGSCKFKFTDNLISLTGETNIVGRSLVVHAEEDDLGKGTRGSKEESLKTGNAGARSACGVIGLAAPQ
ncbi:Superoxide dismutase [Aphelenchoides besseyi]|nr:Superoxide dismutase [Aphelenchoides besseyi]